MVVKVKKGLPRLEDSIAGSKAVEDYVPGEGKR